MSQRQAESIQHPNGFAFAPFREFEESGFGSEGVTLHVFVGEEKMPPDFAEDDGVDVWPGRREHGSYRDHKPIQTQTL